MDLGEWRAWWNGSGEAGLRALLLDRWDPVREDEDLRARFEPKLATIGRRLHEGGSVVDVLTILNEFRTETQDRYGQKWRRRDRRVAEAVLRWYRQETGEAPDRFRTK